MAAPSKIRRLLLADDDRALSAILSAALEEEGFEVQAAYNGVEALRRFDAAPPQLVILDILMPELDGLEVCRRIRARSKVPVILLSSRGEEVDRVGGLGAGADDYVTKPFSTRELVARIHAVGRRAYPEDADGAPAITVGELAIDPARFEVKLRGEAVALTRSEFQILSALAARPGRVLSREQLLELARGDDAVVTDRTVDTFVKRIRKKLRDAAEDFDAIETVFGVGYRYKD